MELPQEEKGSPPKRRGPPRRGYAHLGEPEDKIGGLSGPPRRGGGSPRQTTSPR